MCRKEKLFREHFNSCPLELKILSVLRILGRGGTFDDCFDGTSMDENTIRCFFHEFCQSFAFTFYHQFVYPPQTPEHIAKVTRVFERMGLPGCIGSVDCTHIRLGKCPFHLRSSTTGKENYPSLAYEAVVDHNKRVHSIAGHHYGARNDKTIVMFDSHVVDIKERTIYADVKFFLYTDESGKREFCGAYLICDGGYHRWRCLQCPMKHATSVDVNAFSAMLESIRKDVECFFGILNIRFRWLDGKVEIHDFEAVDNVMYVCCILHNMLLDHDGYNDKWKETEEASDPDANYHETYDREAHLANVAARAAAKTVYDAPAVGVVETFDIEVENEWQPLHEALVKHYNIAKSKGEIEWLG